MINKYLTLVMHAILLASLLATSHGILKWVSIQPDGTYLELVLKQWKVVVLALAIYGLVFFYYILVLRSSPISILYPIYTGLSVLIVMLIGRVVFLEPLNHLQTLGAFCILLGIVFMSSET